MADGSRHEPSCTVLPEQLSESISSFKSATPKTTTIEKLMTLNPVTSREGDDFEHCEHLMQEHQIRRIPDR